MNKCTRGLTLGLLQLGLLFAPKNCPGQEPSWVGDAELLREFVDDYEVSSSSEEWIQVRYFDLFPGNFYDFVHIFGAFDSKEFDTMPPQVMVSRGLAYGPLATSLEYMYPLFDLDSVPERALQEKLVDICIGGFWQADAVGEFQVHMQSYVLAHSDVLQRVLVDRSEEEVLSFFAFFFRGAVAFKGRYDEIPEAFLDWKGSAPDLFQLVEQAFREATVRRPPPSPGSGGCAKASSPSFPVGGLTR